MSTSALRPALDPRQQRVHDHLAAQLGGEARAHPVRPAAPGVVLVQWSGRPARGLVSWATLGLAAATGHELLMVGAEGDGVQARVLAAAAAEIAADARRARVGAVIPDLVRRCFPGTARPHLGLLPPWAWSCLDPLEGTERVRWLLAVPLSVREAVRLEAVGAGAWRAQWPGAEVIAAGEREDFA